MRWCESTANDNNTGTYNAAENSFIFTNPYPQSSQPRFGETAQGAPEYIPDIALFFQLEISSLRQTLTN